MLVTFAFYSNQQLHACMPEQSLTSIAAFQSAITQPRVLLLKYSPICPISLVAQSQLKMFQLDHPDALTMTVNVIGERAIAREIANLCEIEHQSPQAILFESGSATWHASHTAITAESLSAAWSPKS